MFILAGGNDSNHPAYWDKLSAIVGKEVASPTVLSCLFARPQATRAEAASRFDALFHDRFSAAAVLFADADDFYEQIDQADVIYLHGGRTSLLLEAIPDAQRFKEAIAGKIVIGSSAGANYLSTACFSPSANKVVRGSAILNVATVVHYGAREFAGKPFSIQDWHQAAKSVTELADDKPVLLLPEGEFAITR